MNKVKINCYCLVIISIIFAAQIKAQHPAETYGWGFDNFGDTVFTWDIYSHTFFGVPEDENSSWLTATFDKLFFEQAFETTLPQDAGGNCFGLSLLSIMMNKYGGYYGFCAPPNYYGSDVDGNGAPLNALLKRAINIMHGRQLSLACILSYIDQAAGGHSQTATYGVNIAKQTIAKEGPCLVNITKELLPAEGGHSMIGYEVTDEGPGKYKIWVVDPNRIWADTSAVNRGWYMGDSNFINIDGNNWTFRMAGRLSDWPTNDPDDVPGGSLGEGHLTILPISVAGPPGRTPSSMGLSVLTILSKIIIWGATQNINSKIDNDDFSYFQELSSNAKLLAALISDPILKKIPFYEMVIKRSLWKSGVLLFSKKRE